MVLSRGKSNVTVESVLKRKCDWLYRTGNQPSPMVMLWVVAERMKSRIQEFCHLRFVVVWRGITDEAAV